MHDLALAYGAARYGDAEAQYSLGWMYANGRGIVRDDAVASSLLGMAAALAAKLLNEERRLFYVAVTRARRHLVVTASGSDDNQERPSRFLAELTGEQDGVKHLL